MRPERPGKTTIPALTLASFDPAAKRYVETRSQPIEIVVSGEADRRGDRRRRTAAGGAAAGRRERHRRGDPADPRARDGPARSVGASFLRGAGFKVTAGDAAARVRGVRASSGGVRERLARDERTRQPAQLRSIAARAGCDAAAAHRDAGRAAAFYVEIERVLRDALSEKLGVPVGGLRLDELGACSRARGLPADDVDAPARSVLEACDEARFSPGGEPAGKPARTRCWTGRRR